MTRKQTEGSAPIANMGSTTKMDADEFEQKMMMYGYHNTLVDGQVICGACGKEIKPTDQTHVENKEWALMHEACWGH